MEELTEGEARPRTGKEDNENAGRASIRNQCGFAARVCAGVTKMAMFCSEIFGGEVALDAEITREAPDGSGARFVALRDTREIAGNDVWGGFDENDRLVRIMMRVRASTARLGEEAAKQIADNIRKLMRPDEVEQLRAEYLKLTQALGPVMENLAK